MNIANYEQRLALSAHRRRIQITRSPLGVRAQQIRPHYSFLKTGLAIMVYFALFAFFFQSSQAEFEANSLGMLSKPEAVANTKSKDAVATKPLAQSKSAPKPAESTNATANQGGLPPFNTEDESAPSTRQQFTASGYAYGHCTYYVARKRPLPQNWGNARDWLKRAQAAGYTTGVNPRPGAIAQTPQGIWGHVAYVERVEGAKVYISEYNYVGWNRLSYRWADASDFKYIY